MRVGCLGSRGNPAANFLTNAAYDQTTKIPECKVCAVRVEGVPTE